jgi:hypothetical protein
MFNVFTRLSQFVGNLRTIVGDGLSFFAGVWRRRTAPAAENLFLRKQLALVGHQNACRSSKRHYRVESTVWANVMNTTE